MPRLISLCLGDRGEEGEDGEEREGGDKDSSHSLTRLVFQSSGVHVKETCNNRVNKYFALHN